MTKLTASETAPTGSATSSTKKGGHMSKILKATLLLALAVGSFGAYRHIAAQEAGANKGRAPIQWPTFDVLISQEPNALASKRVLQGTYNNLGHYDNSVAGDTFTPIDTQLTVSCPGTSGTCTIQADMWVENGDATTAGNSNAICLYVDGKPAVTCDDSGETLSDRSFTQNSSSQSVSGLTHGNHTVQTYFFSVNGAYLGYYASNYRVYKP
jgi:hypothetical protein